jgi:CHASE2 domain-containing sensor protein
MNINQALTKISKQTNMWLWYGRISPFLFFITALSLYVIDHTSIPIIVFISWIIFISTSIFWWGWIIKTISEMIKMYNIVFSLLHEIQSEVKDVRNDIKFLDETRNN